MTQLQDDITAGQKRLDAIGGGDSTPTVHVYPTSSDVTEGQKRFDAIPVVTVKTTTPDYTGWDQPFAPGNVDTQMGLTGVRSALSSQPGDYQAGGLMSLLPVIHSDATGKNRLGVPQAIKNVGNGVLDLIEGPTTGTVTPEATGTLVTTALSKPGMLGGGLRIGSPSYIGPEFSASPVRPGTPGLFPGAKPFSVGDTMPMPAPDTRMMSEATTKFVDAIYDMTAKGISGTIGGTVGAIAGRPFGQGIGGGIGGMIAGQSLNPVVRQMLSTLVPEQRAAVIANMTARGLGGLARGLGITAISPGTTPSPTDNKLNVWLKMGQPPAVAIDTGGGNGQY